MTRTGYAAVERLVTGVDSQMTVRLSPLGSQDTRVQTAQALERLTVIAVRASDAAPIARTTLERAQLERDYSGQDVPLTLRQAPSVTAYSESGSLLNYSYFRVRGYRPVTRGDHAGWHPAQRARRPADLLLRLSRPDELRAEHAGAARRGHEHLRAGRVRRIGELRDALADRRHRAGTSMEVGGGSFGMARATLQANSGALDNRFAFHGRVSGMRSDGYRDGATSAANSVFASAGYFGDRDLVKFTATTGPRAERPDVHTGARERAACQPAGQSDSPALATSIARASRRFPGHGSMSPDVSAGVTAYGFTTRGFYDYPSGHRRSRPSLQLGVTLGGDDRGGPCGEGPPHAGRRRARHDVTRRSTSSPNAPDLQYPGYSNTGFKTEASAFGKASYALGTATLFGDLQVRTAEFRYQPTEGYGLDDVSQRWSFVNPKVGVTVRTGDRISLFASYGTTGREPTRGDLFAGADDVTPDDAPVLLPLDRVKPEHVNDLEVGATMSFDRASFTVNVFDMRFRDEIARTGATTPLGYDIRANVGRSYRRGIEIDALFALAPSVDLGASMTVSRNRIDSYTDEGSGTVYTDVEPILTPAFITSQQLTWRANDTPDAHCRQPIPGPELPRAGRRRAPDESPRSTCSTGELRYEMGSSTVIGVRPQPAESSRVSVGRRRWWRAEVLHLSRQRAIDISVTLRR